MQSFVFVTHPATMLASELNVARASVDEPFGAVWKNRVSCPVRGSTRLRGIMAAFRRPGEAPPSEPSRANWASE